MDADAWKRNLTVANSSWTASILSARYGVSSQVIYPAVLPLEPIPSVERESGFVCLGRISPEKRIEFAIDVLAKIRTRGHNVHLHVLGGPLDSHYALRLRRQAAAYSDWAFFEGPVYGTRKAALVCGHRYAIQPCRESFGIAVAELAGAGCLPFVPEEGGQLEIVADRELTYADFDTAVERIERVLHDRQLEKRLRERQVAGSARFSPGVFKTSVAKLVSEFIERHIARPALAI